MFEALGNIPSCAAPPAWLSTVTAHPVRTLPHTQYSLENSDGARRYNFNAIVSPYALATTYFPAFKQSVVEGGALGVMW